MLTHPLTIRGVAGKRRTEPVSVGLDAAGLLRQLWWMY